MGNHRAAFGTSYPRGQSIHAGGRQSESILQKVTGSDGCWRYATRGAGQSASNAGWCWSRLTKRTVRPPSKTGSQTGDPGSRASVSCEWIGLLYWAPTMSAPSVRATKLATDDDAVSPTNGASTPP